MSEAAEFSAWLTRKFLDWQTQSGERKSVVEFAAYLEVDQPSLSKYLTGKSTPTGDNLLKIAMKFGFEAYELLDAQPPIKDALLLAIVKGWDQLSDAVKEEFRKALSEQNSITYHVRDEQKVKYRTPKKRR